MKLPLELIERGISLPAPLRVEIEERAGKLDQFHQKIMRVRVTVEGPGRHHRQGRCRVWVDITVPGKEIVVTRQAGKDALESIKEAFNAAGRRVEDHVRRSRKFVKAHQGPAVARVARLFPERGYGFLETPDDREIYFHRNSVLDHAFDHLKPGTPVRYAEEQGDEGPQATTVSLSKRRSSFGAGRSRGELPRRRSSG